MAGVVTLEEVERLTELLPVQDQLKLMARVSERLSHVVPMEVVPMELETRPTSLQERVQLAEQLLAEVKEIEDDADGVTDCAEVVRRLRQRRIA
jgi:hypothetical protein